MIITMPMIIGGGIVLFIIFMIIGIVVAKLIFGRKEVNEVDQFQN